MTTAAGAGLAEEPVRVASLPPAHAYISHLAPLDRPGPLRLDHPLPEGAPNLYRTRWPPVPVPLDWVRRADYDVFHVQFDFDVYTLDELRRLVDIVKGRGIPLVYTVHDLRTPHHADQRPHAERLDVLVPAADALITLTAGAAARIRREWGREATVIPHPHVMDLAEIDACRVRRRNRTDGEWRLGLHLRRLPVNMAPLLVLPVLVETVRELPGAVLEVHVHNDVLAAEPHADLAAYLHEAASKELLRLDTHEPMTDPQLWRSLVDTDLTVLPYRFGTHSGWLEVCRDAGTTAVAPTCGYYAEQGPCLTFGLDEERFDEESLRSAVRQAFETRPDLGATTAERRRQRQQIAAAHDEVYAALL